MQWKLNGSGNTISEISSRICVPNKTEIVNLNVFKVMTKTNESKKFTKNNDKCLYECRNPRNNACKNVMFKILLHVALKILDIQQASMAIQ